MARILFTSITKPVGIDCEDLTSAASSEHIDTHILNKQGEFSARAQFNHDPLDLIACNIHASAVVLHWPTMLQLLSEIRRSRPEYVAMQVTTPTFERAENMTMQIKRLFPRVKVIYGGYAPEQGSADILMLGEGVSKMRELLGEKQREIRHPLIPLEYKILYNSIDPIGIVLNKVGCDKGCRFCSTFHYHKGAKHILSEEQLNSLVSRYVAAGIYDLTVLDENFFRDQRRLDFFQEHVRSLEELIDITCFGCMEEVMRQPVEDLFDMGYHIWIGFEDFSSKYKKNDYAKVTDFIKEMHAHGVKIIASSFIGGPEQSLADCKSIINKVIQIGAYANQINIETPFKNTALYDLIEITDQEYKNYDGKHLVHYHPTVSKEEMEGLQRKAQEEEYYLLGPSLIRAMDISFQGYNAFKHSNVPRLKRRVEKIGNTLRNALPLFDLAIRRHSNPEVKEKIKDLRGDIISEVGTPSWYLAKSAALRVLGQFEATRLSLEKRFPGLKRQPKFLRREYNVQD